MAAETKLKQKHKNLLAGGIWCVSAILAILTLGNLIAMLSDPTASLDKLQDDTSRAAAGPDKTRKSHNPLTEKEKIAQALKEKNVFMPPKPQPQPPGEVTGILGDQALIQGKWYKVGDTIPPGARVAAIEATCVKIVWQGKENTLFPIKSAPKEEPQEAPKRRPARERMESAPPPKPTEPQEAAPSAEEDDLAWLDWPAELKEKFRQQWNQMTPEQKEKAKEQWNNLSDEQKEQAKEAMAKHM